MQTHSSKKLQDNEHEHGIVSATGGAESSVLGLRKYKGQESLHKRKEVNLAIGGKGEFHSKNIWNGHIWFSGPHVIRNMEVATPS